MLSCKLGFEIGFIISVVFLNIQSIHALVKKWDIKLGIEINLKSMDSVHNICGSAWLRVMKILFRSRVLLADLISTTVWIGLEVIWICAQPFSSRRKQGVVVFGGFSRFGVIDPVAAALVVPVVAALTPRRREVHRTQARADRDPLPPVRDRRTLASVTANSFTRKTVEEHQRFVLILSLSFPHYGICPNRKGIRFRCKGFKRAQSCETMQF